MGKIQILEAQLANQIAAGEVVERPASVVKELVENAIDAQATQISVAITEGGTHSIQVSDNGIGMDREDALLAFSRHATSKIRHNRDLFAIRTLGFRGEALPSIASVAEVCLTTSASPGLAVKVEITGGEHQAVTNCSRAQGTDVKVEKLFYNTPARLKYLKMVNTEVSHVADVVGRIALAHPHIALTLGHNKKEIFRTPGDGKLLHVMHALYGKQVARLLLPVEQENHDFRLKGLITKPEVTRASRSYITWILNGRYIRSLPLTRTLLRVYDTLLPIGRYPIAALQIEMDPKLLDVNVHPSKLEVRLSKEKECCRMITEACQQAFATTTLIPKAGGYQRSTARSQQAEIIWDERPAQKEPPSWTIRETATVPVDVPVPTTERETTFPRSEKKRSVDINLHAPQEHQADHSKAHVDQAPFPRLVPLAQIHGTYIVAQSEDGFYLLDQHAAHERIYYEMFFRQLGKASKHQQLLLMPISIETTPADTQILSRYLQDFCSWGIELEHFGGNTFLLRSHPTGFPADELESFINEMVTWLGDNRIAEWERLRDASAKMMACKAAIKANHHLRQDEMEALLDRLGNCEQPVTCPHGRPILVHFTSYELKKMFKRVM